MHKSIACINLVLNIIILRLGSCVFLRRFLVTIASQEDESYLARFVGSRRAKKSVAALAYSAKAHTVEALNCR